MIQAALAEAGRFDEKFDRIRETSKRGLSTLMTGALLILVFAIAYYILTKTHHAWQFDGCNSQPPSSAISTSRIYVDS